MGSNELNGASETPVKITVPDSANNGDTLNITIFKPDGSKIEGTVVITEDIKNNGYTIENIPVADGKTSRVEATITDKNTNIISGPGFDQVTVDLTPPIAPTVKFNEDTNDNGVLNKNENDADGKSNETKVTITVPPATEAGDILNITITKPDGTTETKTVTVTPEIKNNGYIMGNVPVENNKLSKVEATITDKAGNVGSPGSDEVTTHLTPPVAPTVKFNEDTNDDGVLNKNENDADGKSNETKVTITVPPATEAGDILNITITKPNGEKETVNIPVTNDNINDLKTNGHIIDNIPVEDGKLSKVEATITDKSGNVSVPGSDQVTVDITPPSGKPTIEFIEDKNNDELLSKGENEKNPDQTSLKVTIPTGTQVGDTINITVTTPGGEVQSFSYKIPDETNLQNIKDNGYIVDNVKIENGKTYTAQVVIKDPAGNEGQKSDPDKVKVDMTPPTAPVIEFSEDKNNDTILNNRENAQDKNPNQTSVKVTVPVGTQVGDTINIIIKSSDGSSQSFSHKITDDKDLANIKKNGHIVHNVDIKNGKTYTAQATITDEAGNKGEPSNIDELTTNLTPPPPPKVVFVEDIADPSTGKDDKKLSYAENNSDGNQKETTVNVKVPQDSEVDTTQHNVVKVGDILDIAVYRSNRVIDTKSIKIADEAMLKDLQDNGYKVVIDKLANGSTYEVKATIRNSVGSVSDEASDITTVLTAPIVTFTEDSDNNQTLSVQENDKDSNLKNTEARILIPAGAVAGDKIMISYTNVDNPDGPKIERPITLTEADINKGRIFVKDIPVLASVKSEISAILKDGITDTQKSGNSNIDRVTPELRDLDVKFDEIKTLDVLTRQEAISDGELNKTDATVTIPNNVRTGDKLILTVKEPDKPARDIEYTITVNENTGKISSITGGGVGEDLVPDLKDPFVFKLENLAMKPREADNLDPKNPSVNDTTISAKIDFQNSSTPEQKTDTKTIGLEPLKTPEVIFDEAKGANVTSRTNAVSDDKLFDTPVTIKIPKNAVTDDKLTVTIKEPQENAADKVTIKEYTIHKDENNGKVTITEKGGAKVEMTTNNSFQIKGLDTLPGKKTIVTAEITDAFGSASATSENTLADLNEMAVYFDEDVNKNTIMSRSEATEDRDLIKTTVNVKIPSNVVTGDTVTVTIKDVFKKVYNIERDESGNITVKDSGGQPVEISNGIIKVDGVPMSTSKDTIVEAITQDSRGIGKAEAKNNSILEKLYDDMAIKFDEDTSKNGILSPNENLSDPDKTTISVRIPSNAVDGDKLDLIVTQGGASSTQSYTIKKDADGNITLQSPNGSIDVSNNIAKIEIPIAEGKVDIEAKVTNVGDNTNIVSVLGSLEVTGTGPGVRKMRVIFDEDSDSKDGKLTREEAMQDKDLHITTARVTIPSNVVAGDKVEITIKHGDGTSEPRTYTIVSNDNGTITVQDKDGKNVPVDSDGNINIGGIKMADGKTSTLEAKVEGKDSDSGSLTLMPITQELTVSFDEDNASRNGILSRDESMSDDKALHTTVARVTIPRDVVNGDKVVVTITEPQADGSLASRTQEFTIGEVMVQDNTIKIPGVVVQEGQTTSVEAKIQDKAGNVIIDPKKAEIGLETIKGKELEVVFDEDASNDKIMSRDEAMKDGTFNSTTVSINLPSNVVTGDKLKLTISEPGKAEVVKELTINKDDSGKITLSGDVSGLDFKVEGNSIKLQKVAMLDTDKPKEIFTSVKAELTDSDGKHSSASQDKAGLLKMQDIKAMEYTEGSINKDGAIEIDRTQNKADKDISSTKIFMRLPDDAVVGDKMVISYTDPDDNTKNITQEFPISEQDMNLGKIGATILTKPGTDITVASKTVSEDNIESSTVTFKLKITDDKASDTIEYDANKDGIYGGLGNDTLVFNADIDLSQVQDLDKKIDSFEAINLGKNGASGAVKLTITAQDVLDVTDKSDTILKILGDGNDKVEGNGEWTLSADQMKAHAGFKLYDSVNQIDGKTVQIMIDTDIKTDF
ncbi:hypothetical protein [Campylobacter sp. RM16191]|uniref:hypothetical protein n=1 Tax=Campylobacter sp. RM16191 TaxID=1705728 RepID=UPI001B8B4220|nr:hypothetical protein [Campylobacter sp. RM16191]